VDSLTVETAKDPKARAARLYRNLGGGAFEDVTDKAGVGHPGWGMGVCTADVDGDGWEDLYVTALGGNRFYRNNRDGTFADLHRAGGPAGGGWSAGCGFADYDRDGDLDLFVSRYVKLDLENLPDFGKGKTCEYRGIDGAVRPARAPRRGRPALPERRSGTSPRSERQAGVHDPARLLRPRRAWFDSTRRLAGPLRRERLHAELPVPQPERRTFKELAFPMGVAVSEDGASRAAWASRSATTTAAAASACFKTNFAEEYNNLLPATTAPLHGRVLPLADRGQLAALRGWGTPSSTTTTTGCST
jgi:hypothetical protein